MYRTTNRPNTRIEVADALRGIAVAGIILFTPASISTSTGAPSTCPAPDSAAGNSP